MGVIKLSETGQIEQRLQHGEAHKYEAKFSGLAARSGLSCLSGPWPGGFYHRPARIQTGTIAILVGAFGATLSSRRFSRQWGMRQSASHRRQQITPVMDPACFLSSPCRPGCLPLHWWWAKPFFQGLQTFLLTANNLAG